MPQWTNSRTQLQIALGALSVIPASSGLAGMLLGPRAVPGARSRVEPSLDSEYRVTNAFFFATAPVIWASLPRIEENRTTLRAVAGTAFVAGLARLLSWRSVGRPHPAFVAATVLEVVGMPVMVAWSERVLRDSAHRPPAQG